MSNHLDPPAPHLRQSTGPKTLAVPRVRPVLTSRGFVIALMSSALFSGSAQASDGAASRGGEQTSSVAHDQSASDIAQRAQPSSDVAQRTQPSSDVAQRAQPSSDVAQQTQPSSDVAQQTQPTSDVAQRAQPTSDFAPGALPTSATQGTSSLEHEPTITDPPVPPLPSSLRPPSAEPVLSTPAWHDPKARHWSGFTQIDFLHRQSSLDELSPADRHPLNENRFLLRNARIRYQRAWPYISLRNEFELSLGPGIVRPTNIEIRLHTQDRLGPNLSFELRAGLIAIPFGFEMHEQGHADRFFAERSMVSRAFLPGRFDLGASLWGHYKGISVAFAVQNGQPIGTHNFSYLDPNAAKDLSARLQMRKDVLPKLHLQGGVSWLWGKGFSSGTAPTKDTFEWLDIDKDGQVDQSELLPVVGNAGRASENFERWAVGADFRAYSDLLWGQRTSLWVEGAWGQNMDRAIAIADPVLLGRDQRSFGYYVGLSQKIGSYIEIGSRYEHYEPNADRLELFDGLTVIARRKFQSVQFATAFLLPLTPSTRARLLVEYELQDNAMGRSQSGRPAKLNNNAFRTRLEVVF